MNQDRLSKINTLFQEKQVKKTSLVRTRPSFWKTSRLIQRVTTNKAIQSWLMTKGSLTKKIYQKCPQMQVIVLSEKTERPLLDESKALKMAPNEQAWIRCVLLKCASQAWVYARTVIPNMTLENPWSSLQKLGDKPLGEVLFKIPSIKRTEFEFSTKELNEFPYLNENLPSYSPQTKGYARRSSFTQLQASLLLTEVFLSVIETK